ncbi:MAG: 2-hydroxyacyl-CoA dehydratase [Saprospirales bacterium]|nr:2-hydroxyacyl-CoA dehydratase [Saprospirales bacterium]
MKPLDLILHECETLAFDLDFSWAKAWKAKNDKRIIVGYLPIYVPREIIHAANGLPVGIMGAGDRKQIIKGDAYYQSYICHLPRGIVEMALDKNLEDFDGFLFPAICDCVRNLSGMFSYRARASFSAILIIPKISSLLLAAPFTSRKWRRCWTTCTGSTVFT